MSERPKITSKIIEPTESCNDNDLGFFERPSKEFKICQQDNNASEFSDYMKDNPEASFKDIISKTILIKNE